MIRLVSDGGEQLPEPYDPERNAEARKASALLAGRNIYSVDEAEDKITFSMHGADLILMAESDCCDASWFVLDDIEKPSFEADETRNWRDQYAKFISFELVEPSEVGLPLEAASAMTARYGDVTFMVKINTSRGVYTVRMANDHGESGYYSGILNIKLEARL